ncbi:hypothetical protein TWF481_008610 [Arthrobotrys musiformis]|uniref:Rad21/Rec8-like protein N-terminal domain-containing protein n=1 Tax=Arthrobotrys musiformis TaxID=47236 RepID=A0AAV9W9J9_9PEZI
MFYDHRILTQRKYGVATVWLVATIGPRTTLSKRVHKKEILEVNVAKACRTILQSENPLALRLQSNLLFGVSRVFSEQYNYLFTDVSNAHQKINREFLVPLDTCQIDLVGARIRPEALLLQDDPAFAPELSFILPELHLLPEDQLNHTTQLTFEDKTLLPPDHSLPHSVRSIEFSPGVKLVIPDSSSLGGDGGAGFLQFCGDDFPGGDLNQEELDDDVDFVFDENGELQDITTHSPPLQLKDLGADIGEFPPQDDGDLIDTLERNQWLAVSTGPERVWREHEDGQQNLDVHDNLLDLGALRDELFLAKNANEDQTVKPFPPRQLVPQEDEIVILVSHQRGRKPRLAQADDTLELRTSDLAALEAEPLQATFGGANILKLLNPNIGGGILQNASILKGRKRAKSHSDDGESGSEGSQLGRRVRPQRASDYFSRGVSPNIEGMDVGALELDDQDPGVARRGSVNLEGNLMPWNIPERGSRTGSVLSFGGFGTSSVGGIPSSVNKLFSSTGRRKVSPVIGTSRILGKRAGRITPSPSFRQSRAPISNFSETGGDGSPMDTESDEGHGEYPLGIEEVANDGVDEGLLEEWPGQGREHQLAMLIIILHLLIYSFGFELGLPTNNDTQNSHWFAETLEMESRNFFEYLRFQFSSKYENEPGITKDQFITFDELISPNESSRVVAAQGFHHLLHLATRGSVRVEQGSNLEPIIITMNVQG